MRRFIALFISLLVGAFFVASISAVRSATHGIISTSAGHHTSFVAFSRATDDVYAQAQVAEEETAVVVSDSRSKRLMAVPSARGHWLWAAFQHLREGDAVRAIALQTRVCASPRATFPLRI
jgi:hypothetical protein